MKGGVERYSGEGSSGKNQRRGSYVVGELEKS